MRKPRTLLWILTAALLVGVGGAGCGGGGDEGKQEPTASASDVDAARSEMEAARDQAKKLDADSVAKEEWRQAEAAVKEAQYDEDNGNFVNAQRSYAKATRKYQQALAEAEDIQAKRKEYQADIDKFKAKREEAVKSGVDKLAPTYIEYADSEFDKAMNAIQRGRKPQFSRAMNYLNDAMERATELRVVRDSAEEVRGLMEERRRMALEEKADEHALMDMTNADRLKRQGEEHVQKGEFDQAKTAFTDAIDAYTRAVVSARRAQGIADADDTAPDYSTGHSSHDSGRNAGGQDSSERAPEIGRIDPPTPDDSDDSGFDADIMSNLSKLFHGSPQYQGDVLQLTYLNDGESLEKDVTRTGGGSDNLFFKGNTHTNTHEYTFGGNEQAGFLLNARFKDKVYAKFTVQFQFWGAESTRFLEFMVNYDAAKKDYHFLQIGNRGIFAATMQNNVPKAAEYSAVKEHRADVNRWLNRRELHTFVVVVKPEDDGQHYMYVEMDGQAIIRRQVKSNLEGFVGVRWKDCKFYVTDMEVKGTLDTQWAKEALRKKGSSGSDNPLDF